jgi:NADPH-dependent glutamate synthase beta subunit-like oxidoreductase/NAD-dependent dihydropyrimidine dehydrogenase PreA subunit
MGMATVKFVSTSGKEYEIEKRATASILPQSCVNCGKCRELCPVEAIAEQQRIVCRLCPSCTSQPALKHDEMVSLATKTSCTTACPLGISPQGYVNLFRVGKEREAYEHIWDKTPLPSVCGRICHHPCEQECKRGLLVDEPIAIRGVKRYLTDEIDYRPSGYPSIYEETVAVIGAGPAGLAAAHDLSMAGHKVTVFDAQAQPGGMLIRGIPVFRLPREVVAQDIQRLKDAGIELRLGYSVGKAEMRRLVEEYDAVIIAAGAPYSRELTIEGWHKEGVMTALAFMERVGSGQEIRRHPGQEFQLEGDVVVIGGGNVAMDCARTAVRYGAHSVTAVCLESGSDVPAHTWEREEAEEEGVVVLEGVAPQRFLGTHNVLTGVELATVTSFSKEPDGRIQVEVDKADLRELHADWVIVAIGQKPHSLWDQWGHTPSVFFAGDVRSSEFSVVDALASGKRAASDVLKMFHAVEAKNPLTLRVLHQAPLMQKIYPATRLKIDRPDLPVLPAEERKHSFDEVETSYLADRIRVETMRCMECGYQMVDSELCIGCGVCRSVCPKGDAIIMVPVENGGQNNG